MSNLSARISSVLGGDFRSIDVQDYLAVNYRLTLFLLIILGVLIRLHGFGDLPFDHHWLRQTDTLALVGNFTDEEMNIFHPRVDWRGESSGLVGVEFQAYSFTIALLFQVFGESMEVARSVNLVAFALTALVLFAFAKRLFDEKVALLSVFFFAVVPLLAFFAHTIQPDTVMLLASLSAVYFFWLFCDESKYTYLVISAAALCLALLIKPLNVYLAFPMGYLAFQRFGWNMLKRPELWIYGIAVLAPPFFWFRYAEELWLEHGNTFFDAYRQISFGWIIDQGEGGPAVSLRRTSYLSKTVFRGFYLIATPGGMLFLLLGLVEAYRRKIHLLTFWVAGFALTMFVFARQHSGHDYYLLPLALIASIYMAFGASLLWRGERVYRPLILGLFAVYALTGLFWYGHLGLEGDRDSYGVGSGLWSIMATAGGVLLLAFLLPLRRQKSLVLACMALTLTYGIWQSAQMQILKPWADHRVEFASRVASLTDPDALVIAATNVFERDNWYQHRTPDGDYLGYEPTDLYLSRRNGWSLHREQTTIDRIESLRKAGAGYFVSSCCFTDEWIIDADPNLRSFLACAYEPVETNEEWVIYRLVASDRLKAGQCQAGL